MARRGKGRPSAPGVPPKPGATRPEPKDETRAVRRDAPGDEAAAAEIPGFEALRKRGEIAITSFLLFAIGAVFLLVYAGALRSLQALLPQYLGGMADPMEKVLSLLDPKPIYALQSLTMLLRGLGLLLNQRKNVELTNDALDALYAVAFSTMGFMVGAAFVQAVLHFQVGLLIETGIFTALYFVTFVGIDFIELQMGPALEDPFFRIVLGGVYIVFSASVLLLVK